MCKIPVQMATTRQTIQVHIQPSHQFCSWDPLLAAPRPPLVSAPGAGITWGGRAGLGPLQPVSRPEAEHTALNVPWPVSSLPREESSASGHGEAPQAADGPPRAGLHHWPVGAPGHALPPESPRRSSHRRLFVRKNHQPEHTAARRRQDVCEKHGDAREHAWAARPASWEPAADARRAGTEGRGAAPCPGGPASTSRPRGAPAGPSGEGRRRPAGLSPGQCLRGRRSPGRVDSGTSGPPAGGRRGPRGPGALPVVPHGDDEEEQERGALDGGQEEEVVVEVAAVDVACRGREKRA